MELCTSEPGDKCCCWGLEELWPDFLSPGDMDPTPKGV